MQLAYKATFSLKGSSQLPPPHLDYRPRLNALIHHPKKKKKRRIYDNQNDKIQIYAHFEAPFFI